MGRSVFRPNWPLVVMAGFVAWHGVAAAPAGAQPPKPPAPPTRTLDADPIKCWWRTSAGAVRVGEPFTLVLTCAVLETQETAVEPDQSQLDPSVIQLQPFEVLHGTHDADLRNGDRRFFQYEYLLRIVGDDLFGKDVPVPALPINYRVRSKVEQDASVRGRPQSYILPAQTVRVLSLVPVTATDIRDALDESFGDIEARRFRGDVLRVVAVSLFALAALIVVLALVRAWRGREKRARTTVAIVPDSAILSRVGRELAHLRRDSGGGWTEPAIARALAALRIAGAYQTAQHVSQRPADRGTESTDGGLFVTHGLVRRRRVVVSAPTTPQSVTGVMVASHLWNGNAREDMEELHATLTQFTAARYGARAEAATSNLDDSLETGVRIVSRLKRQHSWVAMQWKAARQALAEVGSRVWAR